VQRIADFSIDHGAPTAAHRHHSARYGHVAPCVFLLPPKQCQRQAVRLVEQL